MGTFNASLRTIGDRRGLPAVITLAEKQISILAGDQELGSWGLDEVQLEETGESVFRLEVDGDRILIDFEDAAGFREILASTSRMRSRAAVRGVKAPRTEVKTRKTPKPERVAKEKSPRRPKAEKGSAGTFGARIDGMLAAAEHRWGSLLPSWLFTRVTLLALLILLVATVVAPGLVSLVLLLSGLVTVLFGAVLYTDNMLASRVLPGRMTPMHVLLFGVTTLMLGVLVGVAA